MSRRVVQFDMDGVLADFGSGYDRVCYRLGKRAPGPEASWDAKWDADVWEEIRASITFWRRLGSLVDRAVFTRINHLPGEVYFVTARPGRETKWQTEEWLRDQGIVDPTVIVSALKAEFARAVNVTHAIDDKAGNAVMTHYWSPGTKSYLLDATYNRFDQSVLGTKVVRVASVDAFLDAVEAA